MHALHIQVFKVGQNRPVHTIQIDDFRFSIGPECMQIADLLLPIESFIPETLLFEKRQNGYELTCLDSGLAGSNIESKKIIEEAQNLTFDLGDYQILASFGEASQPIEIEKVIDKKQELPSSTNDIMEDDSEIEEVILNAIESGCEASSIVKEASSIESKVQEEEKSNLGPQQEVMQFDTYFESAQKDLGKSSSHSSRSSSKWMGASLLLSSLALFIMSALVLFQVDKRYKEIERMVDHIEVLSHRWDSDEKVVRWVDKVAIPYNGRLPKKSPSIDEDQVLKDLFKLTSESQ